MPTFNHQHIAVILCEPQQPGNIGAVARAMGNFGLSDLRLINPCQYLHPEARKFAVNAHPLLGSARVYPDLSAALADRQLSIATTRRSGRLRGRLYDSSEVPALLDTVPAAAPIGLVFGREDSGLTSDEVALCTHAATVATTDDLGSLNLGQAVLLFLYEIARDRSLPVAPAPSPAAELPEQAELNAMFAQMEEILTRIAFHNPSRPDAVVNRLRQLIHRAQPGREEVALLRGLWTQLGWSINNWQGRKRG